MGTIHKEKRNMAYKITEYKIKWPPIQTLANAVKALFLNKHKLHKKQSKLYDIGSLALFSYSSGLVPLRVHRT